MTQPKNLSPNTEQNKKAYSPPTLKQYGHLRDLSKGQVAWSAEEGAYHEMNPPS